MIRLLSFIFLFLHSLEAIGDPLELTTMPAEQFINEHLTILQTQDSNLSFDAVFEKYKQGRFSLNKKEKVSFGFTRDVIWASVLINNSSAQSIPRVLFLDTAWLDHADFYFIRQDKVIDKYATGDALVFNHRSNKIRMLSYDYDFEPGLTQVFMRFQSNDPLLIPLYLSSGKIIQQKLNAFNYFYGSLYGAFFILLVYNIALSVSLKDIRYVYYSFYLLSFLSLNIAYTGHGFKYIWPNSVLLQQWLMTVFLYCYVIFGISFCFEFLKLRVFSPTVYRLRTWIYAILSVLVLVLLFNGDQLVAVRLGVALTSLLVFVFIVLGIIALKNGHAMVKYFIPAVLMGAGGAAMSAATTWGVIPYKTLVFHSIEVGMLLEMLILALALAFNLQEVDKARIIAEMDAQVDYLTGLFNRRAFTIAAKQQWLMAIRQHISFSVILIDIDRFKKINDNFGHASGDLLLKSVASVLKQNIRKSDILARWGGEEFIIFLPDTTDLTAVELANHLRIKIQNTHIVHEGDNLAATASFGVAEYHKNLKTLDELIKQADIALYEAKNNGRNNVWSLKKEDVAEDNFQATNGQADNLNG